MAATTGGVTGGFDKGITITYDEAGIWGKDTLEELKRQFDPNGYFGTTRQGTANPEPKNPLDTWIANWLKKNT